MATLRKIVTRCLDKIQTGEDLNSAQTASKQMNQTLWCKNAISRKLCLWMQKRKLILDQSSGFKTFDKSWLCSCLSPWGVLQVSGHNVFLWLFSLLSLKKTQHLLHIKPISFSMKTNNKNEALTKSISKGLSTVLSKEISLYTTLHEQYTKELSKQMI